MPKKNTNAGAAAPTADDTADKPIVDVVNTAPEPQGYVNTTENIEPEFATPEEREVTDKEKSEIVDAAGRDGASIEEIAKEYDVEPETVWEAIDEAMAKRGKQVQSKETKKLHNPSNEIEASNASK